MTDDVRLTPEEEVLALRREVRRLKRAGVPPSAERAERWRTERDDARAQVLALKREVRRLKRELSMLRRRYQERVGGVL